jgi:FlaA1/EpsC-like NDP-sugar epimerase
MVETSFIELSRRKKQLLAGLADFFTLWLAAWLAFVIRLGEDTPLTEIQWLFVALAPLLALPGFIWSGLYRSVIRFVGEHALFSIAKGVLFAAATWLVFSSFLGQLGLITGMPRTVPFLFMVIAFAFVAASRFTARWLLWRGQRTRFAGRQALIYGAGPHGQWLAALLRQGIELFPAGFVDDSQDLWGKDIAGLLVYSPKELATVVRRFEISDVILSADAFKHKTRREVMHSLLAHPVHVRSVPNFISSKTNSITKVTLADLDPLDLLDREPEADNAGSLEDLYSGAVVLVTGAAGSIGSEICRRVLREKPKKLVLLDNSEAGLYQIHLQLTELAQPLGLHDVVLEPVLGDVRNVGRVQHIFRTERPKFVFHAAAYKHLPLIEKNPVEGVRVNVFGTMNCMTAAAQAEVEHFVMVSTDKAVNPASVMGMSKRVAELMILEDSLEPIPKTLSTKFSIVRFGNVLDSSGSVIPLFRRQIAAGGPVTVTHPDVTRYFMTIPQAALLVLKTPRVSQTRDVLVFEMGPPVKILDIAQRMIRFSGLRVKDAQHPHGDIEIVFTGLRPGEKLQEELTYNSVAQKTTQPGILRFVKERHETPQGLDRHLRALAKYCDEHDVKQVIRMLEMLTGGVREENLQVMEETL